MSIPSHIKAIGIDKTGGPEVIQLKEIPTPEVGDEQVLIKVDWAGVRPHCQAAVDVLTANQLLQINFIDVGTLLQSE